MFFLEKMLNMYFGFSGKVISLQSLFESRGRYKGKKSLEKALKYGCFSFNYATTHSISGKGISKGNFLTGNWL